MSHGKTRLAGWGLLGLLLGWNATAGAQSPTIQQALSFRPVQKDVEIETPTAAELPQCKVEVERTGKVSGWKVTGASGQALRRFLDTDGDGTVDQWRYYLHGLEVYRDMDTNKNNKVDQSRWVNAGGARWGVDSNEDGRIDQWNLISAEEATREGVLALINNDAKAMEALLITAKDLDQLGVSPDIKEAALKSVAEPARQMKEILGKSRSVTASTRWVRFDGSLPGVIPADSGKTDRDIWLYENVMAIVETDKQPGLVMLGEVVRVGDVWKLTSIPQPLEGAGGQVAMPIFLRTELPTMAPSSDVSPEMQAALQELEKLDSNAPGINSKREELVAYNKQRADLIGKLVEKSKTPAEREQWIKQLVDGIAAAVQTGNYPEGLERLTALDAELRKSSPDSTLSPYVTYRLLLATYSEQLQASKPDDRQKIQDWWTGQLEAFVKQYPESEDASEALMQLAMTNEFHGQPEAAIKWYQQLVKDHAKTASGERATGALRRLELEGKQLTLAGPALQGGTLDFRQYKGRTVLVVFWATWCKPCTEELPQIKALYQQYRSKGFEVIGVNLDSEATPIQPFLTQHQVPWNHIYQPGGLEANPIAQHYGIISLPTMFLVDKTGKVVSRNISLADLQKQLPELTK